MNEIYRAFLDLLPSTLQSDALQVLNTLNQALENQRIFNVDFQNIKCKLDYSAEQIADVWVGPFWHGRGGNLNQDPIVNKALNDIQCNFRIYSVRDALSASKKLAKVTVQHPMVDAMRKVITAILPVTNALEQVKVFIVKGRRPNPEVEAAKSAKLTSVKQMLRGTCGCCFHKQAILPNNIVHDHGYTRPHWWHKQGSCLGRNFRPLETSDEAPRYMINLLTNTLTTLRTDLAQLESATSLEVASKWEWRGGHKITTEWKTVNSPNPAFVVTKQSRIAQTISRIDECQVSLRRFEKVVAEWKPA